MKLKAGKLPKEQYEKGKKKDEERIQSFLSNPENKERAEKYQYNQDVNLLNQYDDEYLRKKELAEKRQKDFAKNPKLLEAFQRVQNKNMMKIHDTKMEEIRQQRELEAEQERQRIEYEKALQAQKDRENDPFTNILGAVGDVVGLLPVPGMGAISEGIKTGVQGINMLRGMGLKKKKYHCDVCDKDINESQVEKHLKSKQHLKGAGLVDWFNKGVDKIKDLFSKREGFNNVSTRTLKDFGDYEINRIQIARQPIMKILNSVIKVITLGTFDPKKYGFDQMFHLGMIITLTLPNGQIKNIMIEKVDAVTISSMISMTGDNVEYIEIPVNKKLTINQMCNNALDKVGNKTFFDYDAFKNNCQSFLMYLLENSGLLTPEAKKFIHQDVSELAKNIPQFSKTIMNKITDLGQIANKLMGKGLTIHAVKIKKNVPIEEAIKHVQHITKSNKKRVMNDKYKNYHTFRIIPKTKFKNFVSKKINKDILLVLGELK